MTDRVTLEGICEAVTDKAVLLAGVDSDFEYWFPLRYVRVVSGYVGRGGFAELSVPLWLYEQKTGSSPAPATSENLMSVIPADILQRLIRLCHPSKHSDDEQDATLAHNWLLSIKR